jgi:epoxyqueuosine reductase
MSKISYQRLQEIAQGIGLSVVGVAAADSLLEDRQRLRAWQETGCAGDMAFMLRDPELLSSPRRLLPEAKSVVVIGAYYDRQPRLPLPKGHGKIARYAWGKDYHKVLRAKLKKLLEVVRNSVSGSVTARFFSDSVPLLERALARQALAGFIGKNTMFISPRAGSFLFLGEILWDLEVSDLPNAVVKANCGPCTNCLDGCPTQAFVGEKILDARKCISYLTIEKRGALTHEEREWLGDWIFGCDICQDVCPFNVISRKRSLRADIPELRAESGVGQSLDLIELIKMRDDSKFLERFAGTPIMRTKREGLVRNATVVTANRHYAEALDALEEAALHDPSVVVRSHALWSYLAISERERDGYIWRANLLIDRVSKDSDPLIQRELSLIRGGRK